MRIIYILNNLITLWDERHVVRMRAREGTYRILMPWPDVERPLGRSRRRWEYSINSRSEMGKRRLDGYGAGYGQEASAGECGNEL